jgi:hypothetical protein
MKRAIFFLLSILCFSLSAQENNSKPIKTMAAFAFNYSPIFRNQGMYTFKGYENGFFETTGTSTATTVQLGLNLFKNWKFLINTDIKLEDTPLNSIAKVAGAIGWKRVNVRFTTQNGIGLLKWHGEESLGPVNGYDDFSTRIMTAELQFDILGLPIKSFKEHPSWAGVYMGLAYCNYTGPTAVWISSNNSIINDVVYDPEVAVNSMGLSIGWDTMTAALLYDSDFLKFGGKAGIFSFLPWISLYGNFHIGQAVLSDNGYNLLQTQATGEYSDYAKDNVWVSGAVMDMIFGVGFMWKTKILDISLSAGYELNLIGDTAMKDTIGFGTWLQSEGFTIKMGVAF